ncbi:MAG: SRPBCC family protein [Acetobacteraceae bacterium]|nr:SRPBCC family protein [Acetobacteraceae bacterium]
MRVISTASQAFVARTPEDVFRFVTTPDNWVDSHPVTAAVRGNTYDTAGAGVQWIEVIKPNPETPAFEVEWSATIAAPGRLWIIETDRLAFAGLRCRIAYTFLNEDVGTRFHRDMACLLNDEVQLDPAIAAALANPAPHDTYLARVKEKLER